MKPLILFLAITSTVCAQTPTSKVDDGKTHAISAEDPVITLHVFESTVKGQHNQGRSVHHVLKCYGSADTKAPVEITMVSHFISAGKPQDPGHVRVRIGSTYNLLYEVGTSDQNIGHSQWVIQIYRDNKLIAWKASDNSEKLENLARTPNPADLGN